MTKLRRTSLLAALAVLTALGACDDRREPIGINEGLLIVENQTDQDWNNVVVTVNDHFAGGTPVIRARSRMTAPLNDFKTAFGQRYDRSRQSVFKVEVKGTDAAGNPVRLTWDGQRKPE